KEALRQILQSLWLTDESQFDRFNELFKRREEAARQALLVSHGNQAEEADRKNDTTPDVRMPSEQQPIPEVDHAEPTDTFPVHGCHLIVARQEQDGPENKDASDPEAEAVLHRGLGAGQWIATPLSRRELVQGWRRLRLLRPDHQAGYTIPDLAATLEQVTRTGFFLEPVLAPSMVNQASLFLLTDHQGSMAPFEFAGNLLSETAGVHGGFFQYGRYYFNNYPEGRLFTDPFHDEAITEDAFFSLVRALKARVVIFSDAGAGRNRHNPRRIEATRDFLKRLASATRYVCWINPLPSERWRFNSAEEICRDVTMVFLERQGFRRGLQTVIRGFSHRGTV
ncbi:MAG: hypothetical protein HQL64_13795, partial [Magnetococcales bacterium]|nr:hypothetical protein [Magnetococcales bacterium]